MTVATPEQAAAPPRALPSARRRRLRRALRGAAAVAFAASFALSAASIARPELSAEGLGSTTIVLGSWVPTLRDLAFGGIALACSALIAARIAAGGPRDAPIRLALANSLFGLAMAVTLAAALVTALGPSFFTLPETSPGGCRLVLREYGLLTGGRGDIGVLPPDRLSPTWTRGYFYGGAASAFARGDYRLAWHGDEADLRPGSDVRFADATPLRCRSASSASQ